MCPQVLQGAHRAWATPELPAFGVYVHVPFCRGKCHYCDFYSEPRPYDPRYAAALAAELEQAAAPADAIAPLEGRSVQSVYFGGGTPGLLPPAVVAEVLARLDQRCAIAPGAEVTLEVNPEAAGLDQLRGFRAAGVNRLSIGVQSLDDRWLRLLGRRHSAAQARAAVTAAARAGFDEVGVDLILAIPAQDDAAARRDLEAAIALGVGHLSAYLLSVEPGTELARQVAAGALTPLDEDRAADRLEQAVQVLQAAGYQRYEISNYARPGKAARHNRLYWSGGDYLGLGPAAHSCFRLRGGGVARRGSPAHLDTYLRRYVDGERQPWEELEHVDERLRPRHALLERCAVGLRDLERGVALATAAAEHEVGVWPELDACLAALTARGLLRREGPILRLSAAGAQLADLVGRELLACQGAATLGRP